MINYKNLGIALGKVAIVLAVAVCIYFYGFSQGDTAGSERVQSAWNKEKAKEKEATEKLNDGLKDTTKQAELKTVEGDKKAEAKKEIITKEVIVYVQKDNAPADIIDNDWLWLYNTSITDSD